MVIRPESWLEDVFHSPQAIRILRLLCRQPGRYWTGREAAKVLGMPQSTASVAIARLGDLHLLDMRIAGPSHVFRLRDDLYFSDDLKRIFEVEGGTFETFLRRIASIVPKGVSCILFGSAARGQGTSSSDIDLLVVARAKEDAEAAAHLVRREALRTLPVSPDVIPLSQAEIMSKRFAGLAESVRKQGRLIAGPPTAGVAA